jgi:adenosylhomocysteine nucleosidase
MRILFVASDRMEFTGILRHTAQARPEPAAVDWARSGRLNDADVMLVANGVGSRRAAEAVDRALERFPADAVVSTGFCGALDENLQVADLVSATSILTSAASVTRRNGEISEAASGASASPRLRVDTPASLSNLSALCVSAVNPKPESHTQAPILSADHVVRTAEEKRRLRATGACAVEMEAAGVAARAQAHGLRFYCVRSVTDLASESLANDFNAALRADGHFDTIFILGQAFRHPGARLPELLRLRGRCTRAARVLGDFFADCRF